MMPDSEKPGDQSKVPESKQAKSDLRGRQSRLRSSITKKSSNQLSLQKTALAQLRQVIRSAPNRTALAYTLSKDLFLVLKYLPSSIYGRIQNSLNSQFNMTPNSRQNLPPSQQEQQQEQQRSEHQQRFDDASEELKKFKDHIPRMQHQQQQQNQQLTQSVTKVDPVNNNSQSILTDLYGKAAYVTIFMRDKMLNRSEASAASSSSSSSTTSKSDSNATSSSAPSSPSDEKSGSGDQQNKSPKSTIQPIKPEGNRGRILDWTSDPELKPFLHDMNVEWRNIEARTKYLVSKVHAIVDQENDRMTMQYLEDLYNHLNQYREARITAVESGAVKALGRILKKHEDEACVVNCVRETLAIMGWNPPVKGHGIKVLSIDGGGVRGLVAIEVLRMIEKQTGQKIHELFDYICGVSTGSILAFLIGANRRTLSECEALYKQLSQEIFNQNSLIGAGNLFWSHSYYNTAAWEKILKRHIGEGPLMNLARDPDLPRVAAISTLVNQERVAPYIFRTYAFKPEVRSRYAGGSRYQMWEAVRASAAAPTYFEEVKLGNNLHQDGGVLVNNPTSVALSEAKNIWPGTPLQCVMSIGTGQTFSSRKDPNMSDLSNPPNSKSPNTLSWKGKFLKVLDSATDTESVHHTLMELLPPHQYLRFNPHLDEMITMDEARPDKLEKLQEETREYLIRNVDKVEYCCEMLTRPKGVTRKVYDWWTAKL